MTEDRAARLVERERLSPDAHLLWFESGPIDPSRPGRFRAGQFAMVLVPGAGLLRRPYSYCDRREDGGFALLVKEVGVGTRALARMEAGATIRCLGPLGTTFTRPDPDETAVIVAGGVGIAPFAAFCRELAEAGRSAVVLVLMPELRRTAGARRRSWSVQGLRGRPTISEEGRWRVFFRLL